MSFLSHLPLQKPPYWHHEVRMVGRGEPLKETRRERRFYDDLGAESDRNEAWRPMSEVVSGRSVVGFQNLPRQVGRVLTCKECNRWKFLPVGLGGWTRPVWINYPENLSIVNKGL